MTKWQYTIESVSLRNKDSRNESLIRLDGLGQQGWEAVAWLPDPGDNLSSLVLLKAPLP
jgi:hypothetical protein